MQLVFDVGMCDGGDAEYYLRKGFRVVSVEADPVVCERAEVYFREQINDGLFVLIHAAVTRDGEAVSFWRCLDDPGKSTVKPDRMSRPERFQEVHVHGIRLSQLVQQFGIPYYIKIDIEGYDEVALQTLEPGNVPKYISAELGNDQGMLDRLLDLGFVRFKLINQEYQTASLPIFPHDFGWRALRRCCHLVPPLGNVVRRLPWSWRPKIDWDTLYQPDDLRDPAKLSSGPMGEDTHGPWLSADQVRPRIDLWNRHLRNAWVDIHAARPD